MNFHFDLISDLCVDDWGPLNWDLQATSLFCVVAGNLASDRNRVVSSLETLSQHYQAVFYIDGAREHWNHLEHLDSSFSDLKERIKQINGVVYMHDSVAVVEGVAFVAANSWWTYDFNSAIDIDAGKEYLKTIWNCGDEEVWKVFQCAQQDLQYLKSSVTRLQTHPDIKKIVVVTSTVPNFELVSHDLDIKDHVKSSLLGNYDVQECLYHDTEDKITTWCFGTYLGEIDTKIDGIRYVNNARGESLEHYSKQVYFPKRITVSY